MTTRCEWRSWMCLAPPARREETLPEVGRVVGTAQIGALTPPLGSHDAARSFWISSRAAHAAQ